MNNVGLNESTQDLSLRHITLSRRMALLSLIAPLIASTRSVVAAGTGTLLTEPPSAVATARSPKTVTLLVHGLVMPGFPSVTWGQLVDDRWTGMIGFLQERGLRFGGTLRSKGGIALDQHGTNVDPQTADFFCLVFSRAANADQVILPSRSLELSAAIKWLRDHTGCTKVRLVTHSAGGIVARMYIQNANWYRGDVDRLITISAPHLGAALAERYWGLLGKAADYKVPVSALKPNGSLISGLNNGELPDEPNYASIIVRGMKYNECDVPGWERNSDYLPFVDRQFAEVLPLDFRQGGDQLLGGMTQNFRNTLCAARYEARTGKAVQYAVARVSAESRLRFISGWKESVHTLAPYDESVQKLVWFFLTNEGRWTGRWSIVDPEWDRWIDEQVKTSIFGVIEQKTSEIHPWSDVTEICNQTQTFLGCDGRVWRYSFAGDGRWVDKVNGRKKGSAHVHGTLKITADRFGRLLSHEAACAHAWDVMP